MFEIGDKVMIKTMNPQKIGEIVLWYFDEENVWVVECDGETYDCGEHELTPANDAYDHTYARA